MKETTVIALSGIVAFIAVVTLIVLLSASKVRAASFDESLTATSASIPLGADVAGMGNIGTLEDFSSNNPAISSIVKEGGVSGTANYGYFGFAKTQLTTLSGSVSGKIGDAVLQIGFGHAESPMRFINDAEAFQILKNDTVNFQFGGKAASGLLNDEDELYLGIGYAFTQSAQRGIFLSETSMDHANVDSDSHSATMGFAYKPIKQVTIGVFGSRSWTKSQASFNGLQDLATSKNFNDVLHFGFSAKVFEGTTLAADYQHVSFSTSSAQFDQYFVGIEQYVIKDTVALYAGIANGGPTAGLGIYFKHGGLNLSYGHRILPEMKEFLGSADAYMASAYLSF